MSTGSAANNVVSGDSNAASGSNIWKERISGQSIEDLVKEAKPRLDACISSPAKFTGGGFKDARREFTLLAILFAAIEHYPEKIRWQPSAAVARSKFGRIAANTKVASTPVFQEAKLRMEDLATLLKGSSLSENTPPSELVWSEIADRGPSMELLEWAFREHVNQYVASEAEFKSHAEDALKYAELIAIIGETLHQPGMNDADDEEYKSWTAKMIQATQRVVEAVKLGNATLARESAGQLDQACKVAIIHFDR